MDILLITLELISVAIFATGIYFYRKGQKQMALYGQLDSKTKKISQEKEQLEKEVEEVKEISDIELSKRLKLDSTKQGLFHLLNQARRQEKIKKVLAELLKESSMNEDEIRSVLSKFNKKFKGEIDWKDFMDRFNTNFPDLMTQLTDRYPSLSAQDLKLIMLIKLDLNTKEIAAVMNISEKSSEVAKYRLRKKLQMPKGEKINTLIHSI